jgi:PPM family protein phosphatase
VNSLRDDALQKRIAQFVASSRAPVSVNGEQAFGVGSSIGAVRKQNQDRAVIVSASYSADPQRSFHLAVLCDGMGGLARGDEAAVTGLSVFVSRVLRSPRLKPSERLRSAAVEANDVVYEHFAGRSGTTICAIFLDRSGEIQGVNVGDSRIYGINWDREIFQLSKDDTIAAMLGEIGPDGPNQNRLIQFVEMGEGIEPHVFVANKKRFKDMLLTSDGIHGSPPGMLASVVKRDFSNFELVEQLVSFGLARGGHDNGTAVALSTQSETKLPNHSQGLNLTFWSPSKQLEIWIPILGDIRREHIPTAFHDATEEPRSNREAGTGEARDADPTSPKTARKRAEKRRPKGSRKKVSRNEELPLSDAPVLDIKFPKPEDDKT